MLLQIQTQETIRVNDFQGRSYQKPIWDYFMSGGTRGVAVWHRRAGKDVTAMAITRRKAFHRVGNYFHCFPEYSQGRKVLWDGIDSNGRRFIDKLRMVARNVNSQEMKIELLNGSIWQIIGADNYDAVVGGNPVGLVFSEWAISDKYPQAWEYFRPMLAENGGWALWIYTPRGRNHGFQLFTMAVHNPDWFAQILTADDTLAISRADIDAERRAGMGEDMIQQEFYCSFLASTANVLIPYELLDSARTRNVDYPNANKLAGLDVARFGDDRTALVCRKGGLLTHIETWQGLDAIQVAGRILERYREQKFDAIAIDSIGIGAGVADLIQAYGIPSVGINVSESSSSSDKYHRQRDELAWKAREWFGEKRCSLGSVKGVDKLVAEAQAITYDYKPNGAMIVEPKDKTKERLGFSPDIWDAFALTFAPALSHTLNRTINQQERANIEYDPLGGA
jgi:hypothetical protein